jgi:hypothetical protein
MYTIIYNIPTYYIQITVINFFFTVYVVESSYISSWFIYKWFIIL